MTITETPSAGAAPKKSRRGRETVLDMFRTLGIVFALVIPLWFFGQASPSDSKKIRAVDPTELLHDYRSDTGGAEPTQLNGWTINVAVAENGIARIGYVHNDDYMEWQGGEGTAYLSDATDKGKQTGTVQVDGATWQTWSSGDGKTSLVRTFGKATVLVGGVRETASVAQLEQLAATVR